MKIYLMLGRLGDITNVLPALRHAFQSTLERQKLVVAKEYAHLLEGCSYVEPIVWDGGWDRPFEAKAWVQKTHRGAEVIDCTVYGANVRPNTDMSSFNREIWRLSKTSYPFEAIPLVFDRRSDERENALMDELSLPGRRPYVVYSGSGHSSPFADSEAFRAALASRLEPDFELVDISHLRAERPYDLLAIFDKASALVTTDSFPMHLAMACPWLPVMALHPDGPTPWHRSAWRPNHRINLLYSEALRRVDDVAARIREPQARELIYVTSQSDGADLATKARIERARARREAEYFLGGWKHGELLPKLGRDARSIGDKGLPFVRDLVDAGAAQLTHERDIIVFGNADIAFVSGLTGKLLTAVEKHGCAFAHRWDFHVPITRSIPQHEGHLVQARWYAGSDLFACTKAWWRKHAHQFPDMVFGREGWDMVMRNLMKKTGHLTDTELHKAIWHEKHASPWEQNPRLPGNEHNRRLANLWLAQNGGDWNDWKNTPKYRN